MTDIVPAPRVILLAGFPNSGTTIVNYILAQHPEICAPGELYGFPGRQLKAAKMCSCGAPALDCDFWRHVVEALGPLATRPEAERLPALYRILAAASGRRCIVDIAHDLHAVRAVRGLAGIDVTVVHLTRRPAAVLRSRLALNRRQGDIRPYTLGYVGQALRHGRRLLTYQRTLAAMPPQLGRAAPIRVSYEEICERPAAPLARIGAAVGLDFGDVAARVAAGAALAAPEHLIRGNARLRGEAEVRVARR